MDKAFFEKYHVVLNESHAISVMHDQLHKAEMEYKEDPNSKKYCSELATLHTMIEDFFEAKGLDIQEY